MIFFASILATYALTLLLTVFDGPFGVFYRLRNIKSLSLLMCFGCTSVWVGAIFALLSFNTINEFIILTFAYSGAAILIHKLTEKYLE